jgi:XapX domain-containing protein
LKIIIGLVLSFMIGAGCRYFDIPAASPPVIPGALIVLAMTLGYTSMDRLLSVRIRKLWRPTSTCVVDLPDCRRQSALGHCDDCTMLIVTRAARP